LPREIDHPTIVSRRPAGQRAPVKFGQADGRKHEPASCRRRLRDDTCPHEGIAPGTRSGARDGKRVAVEPTDAFQPECVLVTARVQRWARTGPTIWPDTLLGRGGRGDCWPRCKQLANQFGAVERFVGAIPSTNLRLLPSRSRHQPQADRSEQPLREAVPLRPGLLSSPRPGGLGPLSVGNRPRVAAVSLRPKPCKAPPPNPFRFALWFRRWSPAAGFRAHIIILLCHRTSRSRRQ
jgi:hypothetical protein